ncbi:Poly(A) polymerase, nucleotidyltransferase, partial [Pseudoloma neurophilia]
MIKNSSEKYGITGILDNRTKKCLETSTSLQNYLYDQEIYETEAELVERERVLGKLSFLFNQFVINVLKRKKIKYSNIESKIFTFGSYRLGVHTKGADIDTLCVGPRFVERREFFNEFSNILIENGFEVEKIEEAYVPLMQLNYKIEENKNTSNEELNDEELNDKEPNDEDLNDEEINTSVKEQHSDEEPNDKEMKTSDEEPNDEDLKTEQKKTPVKKLKTKRKNTSDEEIKTSDEEQHSAGMETQSDERVTDLTPSKKRIRYEKHGSDDEKIEKGPQQEIEKNVPHAFSSIPDTTKDNTKD